MVFSYRSKSRQFRSANVAERHAVTAPQMRKRPCPRRWVFERETAHVVSPVMFYRQVDSARPVAMAAHVFENPDFASRCFRPVPVHPTQAHPRRRPVAKSPERYGGGAQAHHFGVEWTSRRSAQAIASSAAAAFAWSAVENSSPSVKECVPCLPLTPCQRS